MTPLQNGFVHSVCEIHHLCHHLEQEEVNRIQSRQEKPNPAILHEGECFCVFQEPHFGCIQVFISTKACLEMQIHLKLDFCNIHRCSIMLRAKRYEL